MSLPLPDRFRSLIERLAAKAKQTLESGKALPPMAYVVSTQRNTVSAVHMNTSSADDKERSATAIRSIAGREEADCVCTVLEGWGLPPDKKADASKILDKYGSIGDSPYAIDVLVILLETRDGIWFAEATIKPKGRSKTKRTFAALEFGLIEEGAGRFFNLLPKSDIPKTLH